MRRVVSRVLVCATLFSFWGCENLATGPSLDNVVIENIAKAPTVTGNSALCCCHVTGQATNRNSVPLYISIAFTAYGVRDDKKILAVEYFIPDIAPGATQPIDAPGFIVPCDSIGRFSWEVKVKGLVNPPL